LHCNKLKEYKKEEEKKGGFSFQLSPLLIILSFESFIEKK
jgi:hypothetical protein